VSWHRSLVDLLVLSVEREADPEFRDTLRRILYRGLQVIGGLGVLAILVYVLGQAYGAGLPLRWGPGAQPTGQAVVLADKIVIGILCTGLYGAAILRCSLQTGRMLAVLATIAGAGASLYGDVTQGNLAVGYVTLLYMLAVGAIPFRPRQTLGLGIALTVLACGIGVYGPPVLKGGSSILGITDLLRLGVVTVLLTGISSLLYESRYRQHRARREAEELHEEIAELEAAKSKFFANLSHELKSPLTLILGPIEDALDGRYGDLPEAFRQRLVGMKDQARRLRALVRQLLRLSELEEGRMTLDARPMDLEPFLERMASLFRSMADREGVGVRVETDGGPSEEEPLACVDPDALRQILSNLLSNALDHTPEGGAVRLKAHPLETGASEYVAISVRDTGPGLPEQVQESLFDRYEGVGVSSNGGSTVSTGIGLALVRELVERHGGTVQVESERDSGTEITVALPARPSELPDEDLASEDEAIEAEGLEEGSVEPEAWHALGATGEPPLLDEDPHFETSPSAGSDDASAESPLVLIADDEAPVRSYLTELLAPQYSTVAVEDGRKALEQARETRPDLVISDVAMPELGGFELCEALRQDETLRTVPIILLTVQKREESRMEGLRRGADAYLGKPFRPEELRQRVENLIEVRRFLQSQDHARLSRDEEADRTEEAPSPGVEDQSLAAGNESEFLSDVRAVVEEHLDNSGFGVEWLADEMDLSTRHLQRRLKAEAGLSAAAFIRAVRLERAADLLDRGDVQTVREAASAVGYRDPSHFSRLFKEAHGQSPSNLKS